MRNMNSYVEQPTRGKNPETRDELEEARFAKAIQKGEQAITEARVKPGNEAFAEIRAKHGL